MVLLDEKWFKQAKLLVDHVFGKQEKLIYNRINDGIFIEYYDKNVNTCGIMEDVTTEELWTYNTNYYAGSSTELAEDEIVAREEIKNIDDALAYLVKTIVQDKMDDFFKD